MTGTGTQTSAPEAMVRVRMAMHGGDRVRARALAEEARRHHPGDAALADVAGDLALKAGDASVAERHFADACTADPTMPDYAINHAIALQALGRHVEAVMRLERFEHERHDTARYASSRAMSHRALGDPTAAARWYDRALDAEPRRASALHGRARTALERGEADALGRFDAALKANPGDADLWLGKAQALEVAGDVTGARTVAEQICAQAPGFIAALSFLSTLRLAAGDADVTQPFAAAAARAPQDPNIAAAHIETLAGLDHAKQAAQVAAQARERFPREPHFALLEATHASAAGEWDRAEAIFAALPSDMPQRDLHEARHRIRAGDSKAAHASLDRACKHKAWDISAWALRGIAWRLDGDARTEWLHGQDGLVRMLALQARKGLIEDVMHELRSLHEGTAMPIGQSLRGGTQTRGVLFHRAEPLLAELHEAIRATLAAYRAGLPARDDTHPLLRHRDAPWQLAGSWSVRLAGGQDRHAAHIHPSGIVSSALYIAVPSQVAGSTAQGALELGRPPAHLSLSLEPEHIILPREGHLALFPSTMYHGTQAFTAGERMTVAFDMTRATH